MNGRTNYGLELMKEYWMKFPDRKSEDLFIITFQLRNRYQKKAVDWLKNLELEKEGKP